MDRLSLMTESDLEDERAMWQDIDGQLAEDMAFVISQELKRREKDRKKSDRKVRHGNDDHPRA